MTDLGSISIPASAFSRKEFLSFSSCATRAFRRSPSASCNTILRRRVPAWPFAISASQASCHTGTFSSACASRSDCSSPSQLKIITFAGVTESSSKYRSVKTDSSPCAGSFPFISMGFSSPWIFSASRLSSPSTTPVTDTLASFGMLKKHWKKSYAPSTVSPCQ